MREILGKIFPVCNFGKSFLVGIFWEEFHLKEILGKISQWVYFGKSFPVGIFCEELLQENSAMNYFCCKIGYSQSGYLSKFFLNWEFWEELILTISSRLWILGRIMYFQRKYRKVVRSASFMHAPKWPQINEFSFHKKPLKSTDDI